MRSKFGDLIMPKRKIGTYKTPNYGSPYRVEIVICNSAQ